MKRKTKKRIELLELAIKAAEKRDDELEACLDSHTCLLCMGEIVGLCLECPAQKANYSCNEYSRNIGSIQEKLRKQKELWRKEIADILYIERLKKT